MIPGGATVPARAVSCLSSALLATALILSGCARADSGDERTRLSVMAASSLSEVFGAMEAGFEAAHPEVDMVVTYAGSQVLRLQIEQGATADLFASANEGHVQALTDAGLADAPTLLAHNRLVVVVPLDDNAGISSSISSFGELPQASRLVIGTAHVPLGIYTDAMLDRADAVLGPGFGEQVRARIVSRESNARLVRAKVELGEADAAIVYRTDALASERVRAVEIPDDVNVRTPYVMATLAEGVRRAADESSASAFVTYARSDEGRALLARFGFDVDGT